LPLFEIMGETILYQGPAGSGQHTKMVNQTLIAGTMIGMCEALLYAKSAGLDVEQVFRSVASGAAGSWSLTNLAPRIFKDDFQPGFFVEHFVKDMRIALEEASKMQIALPGLALVQQLYTTLLASDEGKLGTQALLKALERMQGKKST